MVFFDIKLGRYGEGAPLGRIEIELKEDVCPKTTENFKQLALKPASEGFKGSRFHRIIPGFMCQVLCAIGGRVGSVCQWHRG